MNKSVFVMRMSVYTAVEFLDDLIESFNNLTISEILSVLAF